MNASAYEAVWFVRSDSEYVAKIRIFSGMTGNWNELDDPEIDVASGTAAPVSVLKNVWIVL